MKTYKGFHIEKRFSGLWSTFIPGHGYLRADTLNGLKQLINHSIKSTKP